MIDGAIIASYQITNPALASEVKVEIDGTPLVAIEVGQDKGAIRIPEALEKTIAHARELTGRLAPFVVGAG